MFHKSMVVISHVHLKKDPIDLELGETWKILEGGRICLSHFKQASQIFSLAVKQVGGLSTRTAAQTTFKKGHKLQKSYSINCHLSILLEIM